MNLKYTLAFFFLISFSLIVPAVAQDCGKGREILKDIQAQAQKVADEVGCTYVMAQTGVPKPVCKLGTAIVRVLDKKLKTTMRLFFRKMVKNSWATYGPRELEMGKKLSGTLVSPATRMFIATQPTHKETLEIKVEKKDGKSKAGVAVCIQDMRTQKFKMLKRHTFDKGSKNSTFRYTLKDAFGKIVMVHFKSHTLLKKFKYQLMAK